MGPILQSFAEALIESADSTDEEFSAAIGRFFDGKHTASWTESLLKYRVEAADKVESQHGVVLNRFHFLFRIWDEVAEEMSADWEHFENKEEWQYRINATTKLYLRSLQLSYDLMALFEKGALTSTPLLWPAIIARPLNCGTVHYSKETQKGVRMRIGRAACIILVFTAMIATTAMAQKTGDVWDLTLKVVRLSATDRDSFLLDAEVARDYGIPSTLIDRIEFGNRFMEAKDKDGNLILSGVYYEVHRVRTPLPTPDQLSGVTTRWGELLFINEDRSRERWFLYRIADRLFLQVDRTTYEVNPSSPVEIEFQQYDASGA